MSCMKSNSASPWALQTQSQCLSLVSGRVTLEGAKLGKADGFSDILHSSLNVNHRLALRFFFL